jgi:hypothetical protein
MIDLIRLNQWLSGAIEDADIVICAEAELKSPAVQPVLARLRQEGKRIELRRDGQQVLAHLLWDIGEVVRDEPH